MLAPFITFVSVVVDLVVGKLSANHNATRLRG